MYIYTYISCWFWCAHVSFLSAVLQPFIGGGYRLGAAPEEESTYVAGARRQPGSSQDVSHLACACWSHSRVERDLLQWFVLYQQVHVVLKLWKSGFSLDDGELRNYSDPGNALFLESIRRGWALNSLMDVPSQVTSKIIQHFPLNVFSFMLDPLDISIENPYWLNTIR